MLPGNGIRNADKTCFTTETQYAFQHTGLNTADIKEYIRNPHKFNLKLEMDGKYINLWSTDNERTDANDDKVIKSVYDPSPVGYSLPASNAFTGFTTTGWNVGDGNNPATPEQVNAKFPFDKGWYFYTKKNKQGGTVFFPSCGVRSHNFGSLYFVPLVGCSLVAGSDNTSRGRYLSFDSSGFAPLNSDYRSHGFAVRSAEEK